MKKKTAKRNARRRRRKQELARKPREGLVEESWIQSSTISIKKEGTMGYLTKTAEGPAIVLDESDLDALFSDCACLLYTSPSPRDS